MATETEKKFAGVGIEFPLVLGTGGKVEGSTGIPLLNSSVSQLLSQRLKEKFYESEYGSRIFEMLEEPNDAITQSVVRDFIIESIQQFEKRLELISVEAVQSSQNGQLDFYIEYKLINTNLQGTLVYPFYKNQ